MAAGVLGTVAALVVALSGKLVVGAALFCLVGMTAAVAIADVTIDACIARNSIEFRSLAPDMQSLCGFCTSVGALVGYSTSGLFVHHLGAQVCSLSLSPNVLTTASRIVMLPLIRQTYRQGLLQNFSSAVTKNVEKTSIYKTPYNINIFLWIDNLLGLSFFSFISYSLIDLSEFSFTLETHD